ncbi:MAG: hypothetical protein NZ805_15095 [Armatimonadetes bacterium]|nr:hypothetical protein [Armatimonadota bacterium]MDW8026891.1 hypothetical protein [Armatimonadota bacterium]
MPKYGSSKTVAMVTVAMKAPNITVRIVKPKDFFTPKFAIVKKKRKEF